MSKITYEDKVGIEPKVTRKNQWWDDDCNQVKDVVNDNVTCIVSSQFPVLNDKTSAGRRYGSFDIPMSGAIVLSQFGVQEGGVSMVVWEGSVEPTVSGGTIITRAGSVIGYGIYSIYFHFLNGGYNMNILGKMQNLPPSVSPQQMEINNVIYSSGNPPVEMEITSVILDGGSLPEEMEITSIT